MIKGQFKFIRPNRDYRELLILSEIAVNPRVSQRALGRSASITAAMVNHYILELVANEYVSVEGTTNRSMTYHLTPAGMTRRATLRGMMFSELSNVLSQIKSIYRTTLQAWFERGKRRAAIIGAGEKAGMMAMAAREAGLEVASISDQPWSSWEDPSVDLVLDVRENSKPIGACPVSVERL